MANVVHNGVLPILAYGEKPRKKRKRALARDLGQSVPDTLTGFDFDDLRSELEVKPNSMWAIYDEQFLPRWFVKVVDIQRSPVFRPKLLWLTPVRHSGHIYKTGKPFKGKHSINIFSHQINPTIWNPQLQHYNIAPKKGEVWAIHRPQDDKNNTADLDTFLFARIVGSPYDSDMDMFRVEWLQKERFNIYTVNKFPELSTSLSPQLVPSHQVLFRTVEFSVLENEMDMEGLDDSTELLELDPAGMEGAQVVEEDEPSGVGYVGDLHPDAQMHLPSPQTPFKLPEVLKLSDLQRPMAGPSPITPKQNISTPASTTPAPTLSPFFGPIHTKVKCHGICGACGEKDYHDILLNCSHCPFKSHMHCLATPPPDSFNYQGSHWRCPKCSPEGEVLDSIPEGWQAVKLLDVRPQRCNQGRGISRNAELGLEYLVECKILQAPEDVQSFDNTVSVTCTVEVVGNITGHGCKEEGDVGPQGFETGSKVTEDIIQSEESVEEGIDDVVGEGARDDMEELLEEEDVEMQIADGMEENMDQSADQKSANGIEVSHVVDVGEQYSRLISEDAQHEVRTDQDDVQANGTGPLLVTLDLNRDQDVNMTSCLSTNEIITKRSSFGIDNLLQKADSVKSSASDGDGRFTFGSVESNLDKMNAINDIIKNINTNSHAKRIRRLSFDELGLVSTEMHKKVEIDEELKSKIRKTDDRFWVKEDWVKNHCSETMRVGFLESRAMRLLVHGRASNSQIVFTDTPLLSDPSIIRREYRFASNDGKFGITQYFNMFNEEELREMEGCADALKNQNLMRHTIDRCENQNRTKYFFGYRYYDYGSTGTPKLAQDCDPVPGWIKCANARLCSTGVIPSRDFLDLAVLNMYFSSSSGLGVHKDSQKLFARPVVSLRLFGSNVLSFGCQGVGQTHRLHAIPQPRGCVTVMEGYAADMLKHSIRPNDSVSKSSSLMFRKLTDIAKATMIVVPEPEVKIPRTLSLNVNNELADHDGNHLMIKLNVHCDQIQLEITVLDSNIHDTEMASTGATSSNLYNMDPKEATHHKWSPAMTSPQPETTFSPQCFNLSTPDAVCTFTETLACLSTSTIQSVADGSVTS